MAKTFRTVGELTRDLNAEHGINTLKPADISDLFHRGILDDEKCLKVGDRRRTRIIPEAYVDELVGVLRNRGLLPAVAEVATA